MLGWESIYIVIEASSQEIKRKMMKILFCHILLNNWSLDASRWVIEVFKGKTWASAFSAFLLYQLKNFCWLANSPNTWAWPLDTFPTQQVWMGVCCSTVSSCNFGLDWNIHHMWWVPSFWWRFCFPESCVGCGKLQECHVAANRCERTVAYP